MMTDVEFEKWCIKNHVEGRNKKAIQNIRNGKPARTVQSGHGHATGKFASRKIALTLQYESGSLEFATLYGFEHDEKVLEFYDQPSCMQVSYVQSNGKRDSFTHYPDFFVILENQFGYVECKYHDKLLKLSKEHPERYVYDGQRWRCPPCEEEARLFGFNYEIRTEMDMNMTMYANIVYLSGYEDYELTDELCSSIRETVLNEPGITLFDLVQRHRADDVNKMILTGDLYVDLLAHRLADPDFVRVFPDELFAQTLGLLEKSESPRSHTALPISLQVGASLSWSGRKWTIANVGIDQITLIDPNSDHIMPLTNSQLETLVRQGFIEGILNENDETHNVALDLVKHASPKDIKEANYRARQVERFLLLDESVIKEVPERTLRNWTKKYKTAQQVYGLGYLGLLSQHKNKGRKGQRLDNKVGEMMDEFIAIHFENPTQETRQSIYNRFQNACLDEGLRPPSFKTFLRAIKMRSGYIQTLRRKGRRAAYQTKHPHANAGSILSAVRPLERAHCDHTLSDIVLVDGQTGLPLGKPWLTCLIDDYSRRVLGRYISFDPPSAVSCLMALRDCIKRYQRLPEQIVVDNGKEFHSTAFETFLAIFGRHLTHRPPAEPRYGNRIERFFGTINTQFLNNLKGNTQASKTPRQMTQSVDPRRNAVWTLRGIREKLDMYFFEIYDTSVHSSLGFSPRQLHQTRMNITGERDHEIIGYSPIIDILTLPPTPKGTLKVQRAGVKFQGRYYWNSIFSEPGVSRENVPVVYDPYDVGVVFAFVKNQWQKCFCRQIEFRGMSQKQIEIVTGEYRKKHKLGSDKADSSAKLGRFIAEIKTWMSSSFKSHVIGP